MLAACTVVCAGCGSSTHATIVVDHQPGPVRVKLLRPT